MGFPGAFDNEAFESRDLADKAADFAGEAKKTLGMAQQLDGAITELGKSVKSLRNEVDGLLALQRINEELNRRALLARGAKKE